MLFGSITLEVAISLALIYLLLSLICSMLNEGIARVLALRASSLESGIRNLLDDPKGQGLAKLIYDHALIQGLTRQGPVDQMFGIVSRPPYIPSKTFALVLMDIIAPADAEGGSKNLAEVRRAVAMIENQTVKEALLVLLDDTADNVEKARTNVEEWFDNAMRSVSEWYKQRAQMIILVLALALSLTLNIDTIFVVDTLVSNAVVRSALVSNAERLSTQPTPPAVETLREELQQLGLLLGWSTSVGAEDATSSEEAVRSLVPQSFQEWLAKIVGLSITVAAVTLGAPFWFDVLKRGVRLRSDGEE